MEAQNSLYRRYPAQPRGADPSLVGNAPAGFLAGVCHRRGAEGDTDYRVKTDSPGHCPHPPWPCPTCPLSTLESWLLFRGELSPKAQPVQMGIEPRAPSCSPDPEEKRVSVGMRHRLGAAFRIL